MNLCDDRDLMIYEPVLFMDLFFQSQILLSGSGATISGVHFTAAGIDFVTAQIRAGQVLYVSSADDLLKRAYEIVSVNSAQQLTISVLRGNTSDNAIPPEPGTNLKFRISSFGPQINGCSSELCCAFGLGEGHEYDVSDIKYTDVLKTACIYKVLSEIFSTLASGDQASSNWQKSEYYNALFKKAKEMAYLVMDADGDGVTDTVLGSGNARLKRE